MKWVRYCPFLSNSRTSSGIGWNRDPHWESSTSNSRTMLFSVAMQRTELSPAFILWITCWSLIRSMPGVSTLTFRPRPETEGRGIGFTTGGAAMEGAGDGTWGRAVTWGDGAGATGRLGVIAGKVGGGAGVGGGKAAPDSGAMLDDRLATASNAITANTPMLPYKSRLGETKRPWLAAEV